MSSKDSALQIIHFLKASVKQNEVSEDYIESIDVAIDCISDAFGVDKEDDESILKIFGGKNLKQILSEAKLQTSASNSGTTTGVEVPVHVEDDESAQKAQELKLEGNKAMARKDFDEAVSKYTEALKFSPKNVVFLSNRAAAYSSLKKHEEAVADAKAAIEADPSYAKSYSRLGLASWALNRPKDALEAYKRGLDIEGANPSDAMKRGYETAKKRVEEQLGVSAATSTEDTARSTPASNDSAPGGFPDFSNLASMLGGGGNGAPNFGDMLNNPQLMQYAQQMMQNPGALQNLMSNPAVQQMAEQFGLGGAGGNPSGASGEQGSGAAPDLSNLLNNPAVQNLANSFLNNRNSGSGNNTQQ